jgi:hypothetical protein
MLKQIFANIILSLFYPAWSWLNELTSMDHMVSANKINLAEVGADPEVVQDNKQWPLVPTGRTDNGVEIVLATFDTVPTHVTNVEELETNYNKCESVVQQHVNSLRTLAAKSAAYNIAPESNSANTPVLATTGADRGDGNKALTYNDLLRLRTAFNKKNYPVEGRVLLLCPEHEEDLLAEDVNRYNQIMTTGQVAGFKVYTFNGNPNYSTAGVKAGYGTTNAQPASIAFLKSEVMRAMGTIEGEPEKRWADYRGWLLGFQLRFVAMPFRNQGIAAIYSASASETAPSDDNSQGGDNEPVVPTISGASTIEAGAAAKSYNRTYAVSDGSEIEVAVDDQENDWLNVSATGNKAVISVAAFDYNAEATSPRTATFTVSANGATKQVTVSQTMAAEA